MNACCFQLCKLTHGVIFAQLLWENSHCWHSWPKWSITYPWPKLSPLVTLAIMSKKNCQMYIEKFTYSQMPCRLFLWMSNIFSLPFWPGNQQWKFWFSKVTNGESFGFSYPYWPKLPMVKVLVILATVAFIGHFGYE